MAYLAGEYSTPRILTQNVNDILFSTHKKSEQIYGSNPVYHVPAPNTGHGAHFKLNETGN